MDPNSWRAGIADRDIFNTLVVNERIRQERLKASDKFPHTCAESELSNAECMTILTEEVGEVAKAINDYEWAPDHDERLYNHIKDELVQVAAVCMAMYEGLVKDDSTSHS